MSWDRSQLAARPTKELRDGYHVNLGLGITMFVATNSRAEADVRKVEFRSVRQREAA